MTDPIHALWASVHRVRRREQRAPPGRRTAVMCRVCHRREGPLPDVSCPGRVEVGMAVRRLTIPLDEHAGTPALGPYRPGCSLRPESRAAIERAPRLANTVRDVTWTVDDACDMRGYFRSAAMHLPRLATPKRRSALGREKSYRMPSGSPGLPAPAIEREESRVHNGAPGVSRTGRPRGRPRSRILLRPGPG